MSPPLLQRHPRLNVPWGSRYLKWALASFNGFLDIFRQVSKFQKLLCL